MNENQEHASMTDMDLLDYLLKHDRLADEVRVTENEFKVRILEDPSSYSCSGELRPGYHFSHSAPRRGDLPSGFFKSLLRTGRYFTLNGDIVSFIREDNL